MSKKRKKGGSTHREKSVVLFRDKKNTFFIKNYKDFTITVDKIQNVCIIIVEFTVGQVISDKYNNLWECDMIMNNYVKRSIESGEYAENGAYAYKTTKGHTDFVICDSLVFSHRANEYTRDSFDEGYRGTGYYEVTLHIAGKAEYVCENRVYTAAPGLVTVAAPEVMHTARLTGDSTYDRYVFCFDPSFFTFCGDKIELPEFFGGEEGFGAYLANEQLFAELKELAEKIEESASEGTALGRALAYSYALRFFGLLYDTSGDLKAKSKKLPENVSRIKKYIDTYYSTIEGISEIAAYFFYSREHASRLFRQYFNITLSEYLMHRRVDESAKLLAEGKSVATACYTVGFRSVSSYINAFRRITGCLPSEYKKKK